MVVRLGTSGWSYDEWVDVFYPSKKTPKLKFYSSLFSTAEIDSTFYSYPSRGTVAGWARNSPQDFIFSAKLPKIITHNKLLDLSKGVEIDLTKFLDLLEPVRRARKLGVLLIQLPPAFSKSLSRLEEFLNALPQEYRWAVEFRNRSWLSEETWSLLRRYNVAYTIVDEPLLPPDIIVSAPHVFVRWHGHGEKPWYNYHYSEDELRPWVAKIEQLEADSQDIYGYFNNHFRAYAVENCLQMLEFLSLSGEEQRRMNAHVERYRAGGPDQTTLSGFLRED